MDEKTIADAVKATKFHLQKLKALQRAVRALKRAQRAIANSGSFLTRMERIWDDCCELPVSDQKLTLHFDEVPPMEGE